MKNTACALVLYAAAAVLMLYPQSLSPWDTIWFIGDPLTNVYLLGWNSHQLLHDPLRLFDANILHPHGNASLLDGPRLLQSLVVAPLIWATQNPVLGYNVALFLAYLLAAMSGRRLAKILGICDVGAWACGALYAFHTYQISESPRLNVVSHGFLPLALGELLLFFKLGERRRAWHVGGLMLLQGLADQYHVVYGGLLLVVVTTIGVIARPRLVLRRLPGLGPPAIAATLVFLPVLLGYMAMSGVYGFERGPSGGIDLQHYLSTSPTNVVYGAVGGPVRLGRKLGPHFAGFLSLGLAALSLGALASRRGTGQTGPLLEERQWVVGAALLGSLFVLLSLGNEIVAFGHPVCTGPYSLLHRWVPGFQYLRLPERLALIAMLFLALLVGRAITLLRRWGWAVPAIAAAAFVPLEHLSPLPAMGLDGRLARLPIGSEIPEVYRWLACNPAKAIAEVPIHGDGLERFEILDEYFSTIHLKPTIHGYVSFIPLLTKVLRRAAAVFPSELSLQALQRVGVDTVVVHSGRAGPAGLRSDLALAVASGRLVRRARFESASAGAYEGGTDEVYGLLPRPAASAAPFPVGKRLRERGWRYASSSGDPRLAADGDLSTAWSVTQPLEGTEFFQVTFRGQVLRVAGIVLPMDRHTELPSVLVIKGKRSDGRWEELARLEDAHILQLIDGLLDDPGGADLGIDLGTCEVRGLRLMASGGKSFWGWRMAELEVWVPEEQLGSTPYGGS